MGKKVKDLSLPAARRPSGTTKLSSKNQVTIPVNELRAAGLETGDVVQVRTLGPGQVVLTRVDELIARHAGSLDTGGALRQQVNGLRDEWR